MNLCDYPTIKLYPLKAFLCMYTSLQLKLIPASLHTNSKTKQKHTYMYIVYTLLCTVHVHVHIPLPFFSPGRGFLVVSEGMKWDNTQKCNAGSICIIHMNQTATQHYLFFVDRKGIFVCCSTATMHHCSISVHMPHRKYCMGKYMANPRIVLVRTLHIHVTYTVYITGECGTFSYV